MPDQSMTPGSAPVNPQPEPPAPQYASPYTQSQAQHSYGQPVAPGQQGQPYAQGPQQSWQQPFAQGYAYAAPAAQAAPAAPKKSKAPWIVMGIVLFLVVALFAFGAFSCSHAVNRLAQGSAFGMMDEALATTGDTVGVIDITGSIQYDGSACSPEGLSALLDEAEANPDIKAVVLRVNSGGGAATAGEEMAAYVREFSKPIVVSSASMNCSAAYEISSQADYIFTNKTTAIGAIGTILQTNDISGLLDKLGIKTENFTSAESKDSSYGTRPLTEEERAYYQKLVDDINETFIATVAEGRSMAPDDVRTLATGMQFTGMEAVENGLADEIGTYDAALDKAAELGGIELDRSGASSKGYDVVSLTQNNYDLSSIMDLLGSSSTSGASLDALIAALKEEGAIHEF